MKFFTVITKPQTWLNLIYLLLSSPLGIFYFAFLVLGLGIGLGLSVIWVGIPILVLMMFAWWWLMHLERALANGLLGAKIPAFRKKDPEEKIWDHFKAQLKHEHNWRGLLHLVLKFPLGIISFLAITVLGGISFILISSPITIWFFPQQANVSAGLSTPAVTGASFIVGLFLLFASLHAWNGLAYIQRAVAEALLWSNEEEWEREEKNNKTTKKK